MGSPCWAGVSLPWFPVIGLRTGRFLLLGPMTDSMWGRSYGWVLGPPREAVTAKDGKQSWRLSSSLGLSPLGRALLSSTCHGRHPWSKQSQGEGIPRISKPLIKKTNWFKHQKSLAGSLLWLHVSC